MTTITNLQTNYIVSSADTCWGKPRIDGSRIKVQHIAEEYEHMGWSVDEICEAYPHISRAKIHAALSYYYDHQEEIERDIREGLEFAERMEREQLLERMRKAGLI